MNIQQVLSRLSLADRERMIGFLEGMQFAQRICKNRREDVTNVTGEAEGITGDAFPAEHARASEAANLEGIIRLVQVQIGSGQMPYPTLTDDETDAIWRIY